MSLPGRQRRVRFALPAILLGMTLQGGTGSIAPRLTDGRIVLDDPAIDFIDGRALERLRDGGSVSYRFRFMLAASANGTPIETIEARFVVSYDLWEERFAVTWLGTPSQSVSNLTATAAEAWCLNNLTLPVAAVGATTPIWLTLEYRAELEDSDPEPDDGLGFGLGELIEIFSRNQERATAERTIQYGPFRLSDLS